METKHFAEIEDIDYSQKCDAVKLKPFRFKIEKEAVLAKWHEEGQR